MNTAIGRLSILIVGLGVGAAIAASPAMASPGDHVVPDIPLPAADDSGGLNLSISWDGFSLFQSGTADAETGVGSGSFAVAFGDDSIAEAGTTSNSFLDSAYAIGDDSFAAAGADGAGGGSADSASAFGAGSASFAGDGYFDNATASGVGAFAEAGGDNTTNLAGIGDNAFYWGPGQGDSGDVGALAGWIGDDSTGSGDTAAVFDPFGVLGSLALAGDGNADLSAVFGDNLFSTAATGGNFLVDILPAL
jgi:hypothetical protein